MSYELIYFNDFEALSFRTKVARPPSFRCIFRPMPKYEKGDIVLMFLGNWEVKSLQLSTLATSVET
jgi:hypothetical protein